MLYIVLIVVLVAVLAALSMRRVGSGERLVVERGGKVHRTSGPGIAFAVPLLEQSRRVDMAVRRRWAVVTGSTADGATAHVRLEFVTRVVDAALAPAEADGKVLSAVEQRLHDDVATSSVGELPAVGQTMPWAPDEFVAGMRVEHPVVTVCDIEATGELRRLVEDLRKS
jgi:regulator of protease activity HflC (stomatin/prohibitin superfamily)